MKTKTKILALISLALTAGLIVYSCGAGKVVVVSIYSQISVPEEGGLSFVKITDDGDDVALPGVRLERVLNGVALSRPRLQWWMNPQVGVSPDEKKVAYITKKNDVSNIMVKVGSTSTQRTFRSNILDFSWSPDGTLLLFSEFRNNVTGIYTIPAEQGAIVRQISSNNTHDFAPTASRDGKTIFFHRSDGNGNYSIWSYDMEKSQFSNYSAGMTPYPDPVNPKNLYCARYTVKGELEIWRLNIETGAEEIVLSQPDKSFSTPIVSPDGKWILVTGSSITEKDKIQNTDLFVIGTDGTRFTQLTYHPGNDISGVWAPDSKHIYFLSQRGATKKDVYNVWKMNFSL
jgi:Tol biopolymer transport system component